MSTYEEDNSRSFVLHGAVCWSEGRHDMKSYDDAFVVCVDGMCEGVFRELPERYAELPLEDYWDKLIIPGFVDLHTHAPQYQFRGLGMDMELLDWLDHITFPEEMRYARKQYAERAYDLFVEDLYVGPITRAVIFATKHVPSTLMLMDMLEETGLVTYVGKVNMDRNVADGYIETTEDSLSATVRWLKKVEKRGYGNTYPILTPRFTVSCTRELMTGLGKLAEEYKLPVQSHLSENLSEIEFVSQLEPDTAYYGDSYEKCGLFGTNGKCVMAHCVWSGADETAKMKENGVFIAHCPSSNMNLSSGVAPVSKYLDMGLHAGLGTDVAGGTSLQMFRTLGDAITASKLRWRLMDQEVKALTFPEVFYMATKGGGEFFGKVGSFEKGYEFDALVIDDASLPTMRRVSAAERTERLAYLADDRHVVGKYVRGRKLY